MSADELIESLLPKKPSFGRSEVAELFGLEDQTLAAMACKKTGPSYFKVGRKVIYTRDSLAEYLRNNANVIPTQL